MTESNLTPLLEKNCVVWSSRQARNLALRVYYDVREQDGCKIYTLRALEEGE
jgi:hypothetical protein